MFIDRNLVYSSTGPCVFIAWHLLFSSTNRQCMRLCNHISSFLPKTTKEPVFNAIIISRLDYCNSLIYDMYVGKNARLRRMHTWDPRLILRRPWGDSALPLLCEIHWLSVGNRIDFKVWVFTYAAMHDEPPLYLCELVTRTNRYEHCALVAATSWKLRALAPRLGTARF